MTNRYSIRECRELLLTNEKSLKAWLTKAGIEPQIDLMDERKKYLTRAQLEQLAKLHGRTLPEEEETSVTPSSIEVLTAQITTFHQTLEHRIDQVEQAIQRVLDLLQAQTIASTSEKAIEQQATATPPASSQPVRPATTIRTTPTSSKRKKTTKGKEQKLPRDYVPLRIFAQEHQISLKATEFASKAQKIKVERGRWRYNTHLYVEALSLVGQQEFYQRFHMYKSFTKCEQCPHTLPTNEQV